MDMDSIFVIVGIVVLLGVAGASAFAVLKVRQLQGVMDTKVDPMLDELKAKVEALKPVVDQTGDLMQRVNLTLDTVDIALIDVDSKLAQLEGVSGKVVSVTEAIGNLKSQAKSAILSR